MKISKLMCAAFAAAMVLAGCSKEETPEEVSKNYKSVDVVISNVKMATKLGGTDEALCATFALGNEVTRQKNKNAPRLRFWRDAKDWSER